MFYENLKKYSELDDFNDHKQIVGLLVKGKNKYVASTYIRLLSAFNNFNDGPYDFYIIDELEMEKFKDDLFNEKLLLDIIIVQRDVIDLKLSKILVKACNLFDIKFIYEIDDDLVNMDKSQPDYKRYEDMINVIKYLIVHADCVTVTTNNLKNSIIGLNDNVVVIPNALVEFWDLNNKLIKNDEIKIGYMGTTTHANDLKLVEKAISNLKTKYDDKIIKFEIIGGSEKKLNGVDAIAVPPNSIFYPDFVNWIQKSINWDIAIAPLADNNNINESKSELKYLEYTALNVPAVYSDVGPYKECISHGINGLLVKNNSTEEWESNLVNLIEDSEFRHNLLKNAREDVSLNYTLDTLTDNWKNILDEYSRDKNSVLYLKIKEFWANNYSSFNKFLNDEAYSIIKSSNLFDENYYLTNYPEVKNLDFDSINHYITFGKIEGTNPCKNFDSEKFTNNNPLVSEFEMSPFLYFILYGNSEKNFLYISSDDYKSNLNIIKNSDVFNPKFYLESNMDVKKANIDPYAHYVKWGYKESFRKPIPNFSNVFYENNYIHNINFWNPLTHYIIEGKNKGYKTNSWAFHDIEYSDRAIDNILNAHSNEIFIIIPVFNFSFNVIDCIDSIINNTNQNYKLVIFINENIVPQYQSFFDKFSELCSLQLHVINGDLYNSINEFLFSSLNDVVILNSYSEVTHFWLSRLLTKAYSDERIGMVSPVSNFMVDITPFNNNEKNSYDLTIEGISTIFRKYFKSEYIYSNVADSFCIFIKNNILQNLKSEKSFIYNNHFFKVPDNITHVIDDFTYVYHNEEFFLDNPDLVKNINPNPSFEIYVKKFLNSPVIKKIKSNFDVAMVDKTNITLSNRILFIINENELKFSNDFMEYYVNKHYDSYFLTCDNNSFKLWKDSIIIKEWDIGYYVLNNKFRNNYLKEIYFNILSLLNIDLVQINNVKFNSFDLFDISNLLNIPTIFNCYNNYYIDSAVFDFCASVDSKNNDFEECYEYWYDEFNRIFKVSSFIFHDEKLKDEYCNIFSNISHLIVVNKLNINYELFLDNNDETNLIDIFVPGNLLKYELSVLKNIKEKDTDDLLNFHFLGDILNDFAEIGDWHGDFSREMLLSKIDEISPKFILLLKPSLNMFDIIEIANLKKIPLIFDENLFELFMDELSISNFTNFKNSSESFNYIINSNKVNNYYSILKNLFYQDIALKKELIMQTQMKEDFYFNLSNISSKFIIPEEHLSDKNNAKNTPFSDFQGFLANSYVSPLIYAPFVEEDKRCFAVMDNISKYLRKNVSDDNSLVSVIMSVYNRLDIVELAINSVLNQTYKNFEFIIVDDGSTDGTDKFLSKFDDNRIRLILSESNNGASYARNLALSVAEGDYIMYLDSDNQWDSRYIETMLGAFKELPDADALYSGQLLYDSLDSDPFAMRFGSLNKSLLKNGNYIDMNCFAHTKKVFSEIGGFDESLYRLVDWDFILRICNNFKVYSIPVLLSYYYLSVSKNSISDVTSKNNEKKLEYKNFTRTIQYKNDVIKDINYKLNKKVTIIIPSFESLKDIIQCINAIKSFKNDLISIIVVDNNSSFPTRYYLECLQSEGSIDLIQNDANYGFTYAVNQGISLSDPTSDILLLNNDAVLSKCAIESMQKFAYECIDCGIVVPQQVLPGGTHTMKTHVPYASPGFDCDVNPSAHHKNIINMPIFHDGEILELSFAPFFCTYIKRDVLDNSFGLDAELGRHYRSDRIFSDYVRNVMNLRIYHVSDAVVYHKLQRSTMSLKKNKTNYDTMFLKNQWEDELAIKLGFKKAKWDF